MLYACKHLQDLDYSKNYNPSTNKKGFSKFMSETIQSIRLNKFISDSGYCSRREADRLIAQNNVCLNGIIATIGSKVFPDDVVLVKGQIISAIAIDKTDRIYIAYHKPIGITCTTLESVKDNITHAINHSERIFPIGRLDKPSEGLIFLTNDGDIVNKILRAENAHDKEYIVTVNRPITPDFIAKMAKGVPILETITQACQVKLQSRYVFNIILTQGLNRQIRRMCQYLGYKVTKLVRSRIMNVSLGTLRIGQWRNLTPIEMSEINLAIANSRKTASNTNTKNKPQSKTTTPPQKLKHNQQSKRKKIVQKSRNPNS